jgi:hypothetical protein
MLRDCTVGCGVDRLTAFNICWFHFRATDCCDAGSDAIVPLPESVELIEVGAAVTSWPPEMNKVNRPDNTK